MRTPLPARTVALRDWLLLTAAAVVFLGVALGARDLWNPNEPTYGRIVAEMVESGDWLVPRLNGQDFVEKPILFFWLAGAASKLAGGVSEVTVRLPVFVTGVASTLLLFLLVHGYDGRRRAWFAAACFLTTYAVWFNARNGQMDSFVLLGTLGIVVPLARRLDGDWSGRKAWLWAGAAAGIGFAGKGPVSIAVPGLVFATYLLLRRRDWRRLLPGLPLGLAMFALLASPSYLMLWLSGRGDALHEMLFRQNFSRFVAAWDHDQPWWYYLKYFWMTFAPWSWFVPAAALDGWRRRRDGDFDNGDRLAWIWLLAPLVFFSLSDSKREPYMLPAAPAVAWLASRVSDRFLRGRLDALPARLIVVTAALLGMLLLGISIALPAVAAREDLPAGLSVGLAVAVMAAGAACVLGPLVRRASRRWAPLGVLAGFALLYLLIALHLHGAVNPLKSSRALADRMRRELPAGAQVYSHLPRHGHIRGGYAFYLQQPILNLPDAVSLEAAWREAELPCILWEEPEQDALVDALPGGSRRLEHDVGSRRVRVACRDAR